MEAPATPRRSMDQAHPVLHACRSTIRLESAMIETGVNLPHLTIREQTIAN
jgi:hypothetical protein